MQIKQINKKISYTRFILIVFIIMQSIINSLSQENVLPFENYLGKLKSVDSLIYSNLKLNIFGLSEIATKVKSRYKTFDKDDQYQKLFAQYNLVRDKHNYLVVEIAKLIKKNKEVKFENFSEQFKNIQSEISKYSELQEGSSMGTLDWTEIIKPLIDSLVPQLVKYTKRQAYAFGFKAIYKIPKFKVK